ncbi:MAG TPA: GNAT family N-acetyltransferase [Candidatus Caccocola faecipullorum]|nr:GNAT family N-acetyltransferase [Candidatus Caccocola faecipullorum]
MEITEISEGKEKYIQLLLVGDEEEAMIMRYLPRGQLFVMRACGSVVCAAVVTDEGGGTAELKNISVEPEFQRRGYGSAMMEFLESRCKERGFSELILGTGETPHTLGFYESCGYSVYRRERDFFTKNYSRPIIDRGVLLRDMIYLKKKL